MKKLFIIVFFSVIFTTLFYKSAFGLTENDEKILDLRKQIEELTKQSQQYNNNVKQKQKEGDTLKKQIALLSNQILQLQTQIKITEKNIDTTKLEISNIQGQIFDSEQLLQHQKATIGKLIVSVYERDKKDFVATLLSSGTLSDLTNYAQQNNELTNTLLKSLNEVKEEKEKLEEQNKSLEDKKQTLEGLYEKSVQGKQNLSYTKENKDGLLVRTKGQEEQYQKLLQEVEQKKTEFFSQLRDLESRALQDGAFIVHVKATSIPPRNTNLFIWPEDSSILTQSYGRTKYANRGAYGGAPHNGIDMSSGMGTPIHPVAIGTILASGFNSGFGNWVAVRHQNDLVSLYGHLRSPSALGNGLPVTTQSVIGYEGSTGNSTGSHLHLSIYQDFFTYLKNGQLYFNYFDGSINPLDYLP